MPDMRTDIPESDISLRDGRVVHLRAVRAADEEEFLQAFARIDNALDRFHIGSVIVNEGNGRFYEPGAGRTFTVGARWHWEAP